MKNFRLTYFLALALMVFAVSCEQDLVEYGPEQSQKVTDAYLQIKTPVISFQAGTPSYTMEFNVVNGEKRLDAVEVYKVFTDAATGNISNKALLNTYNLDAGGFTAVSADLTYEDLKSGLTVNDGPLPADEVDLAIGSGWTLTFLGKSSAHGDIPLNGSIRVSVLSRFAGLYKVVDAKYFRIGVPTDGGPWVGETRFIGSVDANTFSYNDFWGPFAWGGNGFNFDLDESTNKITVPIPVHGLYSGNRALSCDTEPSIFTNVPCDGSNILIPDDVNGHHTIKLTYGYFTDGSGAREFYEVLEKL